MVPRNLNMRNEVEGWPIFVRKDSEIKTLGELNGKEIIVRGDPLAHILWPQLINKLDRITMN